MSTKKVSSPDLTKSEKEAIKAKYQETTSLREYVMTLTKENPKINLVALMKHIPEFTEHLLPAAESKVFRLYFVKEMSISEISGVADIGTCAETEKILKRADKAFRKWALTYRE
nr:MAG TPA: RNA polymerase sigma factor [Caudoviricetes sp.]